MALTPSAPAGLAFERAVTHTPVLAAAITDPDGGVVSGQFYARTQGSATWNLTNGVYVQVASGQVARSTLPAVPAGTTVEWQVRACDVSTCSSLSAIQTNVVSPMLGAGNRKSATPMSFTVGDRVSATVEIGTGNLLVSTSDLSAQGVAGSVPVGMAYNSLAIGAGVPQAQTSNPAGFGWTQTVGYGTRVEVAADGSVVYWGPAGFSGTFVPALGGGYTPPKGVTADLKQVGATWELWDHTSAQTMVFNSAGRLTGVRDRNNNLTEVKYANAATPTVPSSFVGTAGPSNARTINIVTTSGRITGLSQTVTGATRTVGYGYDTSGDLTTVTDPLGRVTTFTYTGHKLTKIVAPGAIETHFAYDARNRVTSVRQVNTTAGSSGDTWTRLAYPTEDQVLVSDGAQEQAGSPVSGAKTTYTLDPDKTGRVKAVKDALNRERSTTFSAHYDTELSVVGSGATTQTTTNSFDPAVNGGESQTGQKTQGGATAGWKYENTQPGAKYLPSEGTDASSNTSTYKYDTAGNQLSTTDAMDAMASVKYRTDGTIETATAPGNTSSTAYGFNANKQMTSVTPPAGTTLGVRNMTYDAYGRLATETNGRGITTTYTYDKNDRTTGVDYSGTTPNPDVSFTYDAAGRQATRTDVNGTTTYTYDQVNNLRTRKNTADNITITHTYDNARRLASVTDGGGLTTYAYDTTGALLTMEYPKGTGRATTRFKVDDKGRRTDTWMDTDANNTVWSAHSETRYDSSGRPQRIIGQSMNSGRTFTDMDVEYCYSAGAVYPSCNRADNAVDAAGKPIDRSMVQWRRDHHFGSTTNYTYDAAGRLLGAKRSQGYDVGGMPMDPVTYAYTYDARGNRLTATTTTGPGAGPTSADPMTPQTISTQTRTYDSGNLATSALFAFDGAGNVTASPGFGGFSYTNGDQLSSVVRDGVAYNYTYAGVGQSELIAQTTPEGNYAYTYGRDTAVPGRPVIEQVKLGTQTAYVENDPSGRPIQLRTPDGRSLLYIYDAVGSPMALFGGANATAETDYRYDPFGVRTEVHGTNHSIDNPFAFTGGLYDRTTNWVKMGARYYSPASGRWWQMDTLDAPLDPLNANRYVYAANNPVNYVDPTGRFSGADVAGEAMGVIGFAAVGAPLAIGLSIFGPVGMAAGAFVGGCIGGALEEGTVNALEGSSSSGGDLAGACAVGGASATVLS